MAKKRRAGLEPDSMISLRIPSAIANLLKAIAEEKGMNLSTYAREVLTERAFDYVKDGD